MKADGSEVTQLVPLQHKAWAQCAINSAGVSLEIEGFTADGLPESVARPAAAIVAWLCREYGIPPTWAKGGLGRGVCQHVDLGADWLAFIGYVKDAFDAFGPGALPTFALHGAPGPHQVAPTPDVAPEPSHGGAARNEPGDTHAHATPSGYPAHSVAALQSDLNAIIKPAAPLLVDGRFGGKTQSVLEQFQRAHGLVADGLIGPASWAALDAAMTGA
jgi:hypothetical protein